MTGVLLLNKQVYQSDKRLDQIEINLMVLRYQMSNMTRGSCQSENDGRLNQLQNQVDQLQKLLQRKFCARASIADGLETTLIINRTTQFSVLVRDFEGHDLSSGGAQCHYNSYLFGFSQLFLC